MIALLLIAILTDAIPNYLARCPHIQWRIIPDRHTGAAICEQKLKAISVAQNYVPDVASSEIVLVVRHAALPLKSRTHSRWSQITAVPVNEF